MAELVLTSQLLVACRCDQQRSPPIASAARSSASHEAAPEPGAQRSAPLVLSAVPREGAETWSIVARSPQLHLDAELTTVSASTLCGVFSGEELSSLERAKQVTETILLTCSAAEKFWIAVEGQVLRLGEQRHPIPAGIRVELPSQVQHPPAPPCPADTPRVEVPAKLVHQRLPSPAVPDLPYQMRLIAGREQIALQSLHDYPMGCDSERVFPKSTVLSTACTYTEAGFSIRVFVKQQDLWIEGFRTGYHDPEPEYRIGRRLPCGGEVRFSHFHLVHGSWKPNSPGPCRRSCNARTRRCEDRCYARYADDRGSPSPGFFPCRDACTEASMTCDSACVAAGH